MLRGRAFFSRSQTMGVPYRSRRVTTVPEPGSLALPLVGLGAIYRRQTA